MKWLGQHIWDFISKFRNYVYLERVDASTSTTALVVDSDGKVGTNTTSMLTGAMFSVSGNENSFDANRWLIPRRYKDGAYLSGASEDFSSSELATISFDTHLRLQGFVADGVLKPLRYEIYIAMQQTTLAGDLQFGVFEDVPTDGDATLGYAFTSYATMQPHGTTDRIKRISGTISDTLAAGTLCSFGFHNPSGGTDIDDFKYWITVYFN